MCNLESGEGKVFRQIVFDYIFGNGDAHLKNFSVYESELGDYVMTPAYDLLSTSLHYPNDLTLMALSLFRNPDFMTKEFEALGYYSFPDFIALGRSYNVDERTVRAVVGEFKQKADAVERFVKQSFLSMAAQTEYLRLFRDRLAMFR